MQTDTIKTEQTTATKSPLQRDWEALKAEAPDHIIAVRLGDFYELFNADAVIGSKAMRVALTKRNGVPMAGFPFHARDTYLKSLTDAGLKVAIVDIENGKRVITERL